MKKHLTMIGCFLVLVTGIAQAEEVAKTYAPNAAEVLVAAATKQAKTESKLLFIKSGWPGCGYCRMFDRYHHTTEVEAILSKFYVVISIDIENMPDGKTVFTQFAQPGGPSWAIVTPEKKVVVTSFLNGDKGNTGFPVKPNEMAHYLGALKKASPAITQEELDTLSATLLKIYGR